MARRSDHTRDQLRKMAIDSAVKIVEQEKIGALTVRRVTKEIGYTPGTLYQIFDNLDALILEVHIQTLNELHDACVNLKFAGDPEADLAALATQYSMFAGLHGYRWRALFEFSAKVDARLQQRYDAAVLKLIHLVQRILAPLYATGETARAAHDARVLWSSLYGIVSLASMDKLSETHSAGELVQSLIHNYLGGLRHNPQLPA